MFKTYEYVETLCYNRVRKGYSYRYRIIDDDFEAIRVVQDRDKRLGPLMGGVVIAEYEHRGT